MSDFPWMQLRYTFRMLRFLHQLSAFFFYVLGFTFFLAYILLHNNTGGTWPAYWVQVGALPLALCAVLYAGLSLYTSLHSGEKHSRFLMAGIGLPLLAFFLLLLVLNFWPG
jgi:hypothetical protein